MVKIEPRKSGRLGEGYTGQSLGFTGVVPIRPVYVAVLHTRCYGDDPPCWDVCGVYPSANIARQACNVVWASSDAYNGAAVVCIDGVVPAGDGENWYAYGCLLAYAPDSEVYEATPADEPILAPDVLDMRAAVARHLSAQYTKQLHTVAPHPTHTNGDHEDRERAELPNRLPRP